jgi:phosphate uptake regulator
MYGLVLSMLEDSMIALRDHNVEIADDIIQRDDEVDRFYFLSTRQLNATFKDIELFEKIGIKHLQECLGYRLMTKIVERIGDHAVKIAINVQKMNSTVNHENPIFKMAELSSKVFESTRNLMTEEDLQTINKIVVEAKNVSQLGFSLESREIGEQDNVEISMVLESLRRIAEYSGDIAEVAINISVKRYEPER